MRHDYMDLVFNIDHSEKIIGLRVNYLLMCPEL